MSVILVGVDDSDRSEDAIAFARELARDTGARVVVASAFPYDDIPSRAANLEFREAVESAAGHVVAEHARRLEELGDRVATATVARTSAAHGLQDLAVSQDAALIVVGSTHTARHERVLPGSTSERLLHGAPCAVAVVPKGYRSAQGSLRSIGVAWDGSHEADAALDAAMTLGRALRARVRVIRVIPATPGLGPSATLGGSSTLLAGEQIERAAEEDLATSVRHLAAAVEAEGAVVRGDPVDQLRRQTEEVDLLITGSRGYGPLRATLLGGVTGQLLREAACPVIVVPRGVDAPLDGLFPRVVA